MEFRVTWTIDLDAESAEEAAKLARQIQLDPKSLATHFTVTDEHGATQEVNLESELPEATSPQKVFVTIPLEEGLIGDVRVFATKQLAHQREQEWCHDHEITSGDERFHESDWGTSIGTTECEVIA